MTKKKLIPKLISHYRLAIQDIKSIRNINKIETLLARRNLFYGTCNLSEVQYNKNIYHTKWVQKYCTTDSKGDTGESKFWGITPSNCRTKKDILAALQVRVDILKKELKKIKS